MCRRTKIFLAIIGLGGILGLASRVGPWLIIDRPEKSDALLILAGDEDDVRLRHGEELLRQGLAAHGFIDAVDTILDFGKTPAQHAEDYLALLPPDLKSRMSVCAIEADSTAEEMAAVRPCLERVGARRVLIVTSDYHTRRSLAVARKVLPQYQWSTAAARTQVSGPKWWRSRWAMRNLTIEWEKLIWWTLVDSHRV